MSMTTEQRDKLIADLATVRETKRVGIAHYHKIAATTKERRLAKDNLRSRIRSVDERIGAHYASRPRAFDYLGTTDPECVEWSKSHKQLEAERQVLIDEIRSINAEEFTLECIQYEGSTGLIAQWELAEGNLIHALERDADERRGPWERGEISAVR